MTELTKRDVGKGVAATVIVPSFATVTTAKTNSGEIEMTTTSTQPTNTSVSIMVFEDTSGNGNADNQQENSIPAGSGVVTQYDLLAGSEAQGNTYWFNINLKTTDTSVTPELSSMTITLPEQNTTTEPQEPTDTETDPQSFDRIIDNYLFFVIAAIGTVTGIGLASKSLAVASVVGYLVFAHIAIKTGETLLQNILIVTLVLIFIGFSFKFWRLEGMGEA